MNRNTAKAPERRSVQRQGIAGIGKIVGNMTIPLRERIIRELLLHVGSCGEFELARIVSKNLHVPEAVVDAVLMASYLEERSRRAALETIILGAVDESARVGRAVWAELREAAA